MPQQRDGITTFSLAAVPTSAAAAAVASAAAIVMIVCKQSILGHNLGFLQHFEYEGIYSNRPEQ